MFNSQSKIRNLKSRGFSLIEAMAAVLIIVIGMVGVLSLVAQNIKAQNINKNELIASQLAQEGLELFRFKRDAYLATGSSLAQFMTSIGDTSGTINYLGVFDNTTNDINAVKAILYINSDFYDHNIGGTPTIFSRLINIEDKGDYLNVECTVQWKERGNTKQYVASTLLYDWR